MVKSLENRSYSLPDSNNHRVFRYFDLIMVFFVTVLIVSNIASSAKTITWGINLFGQNLAFDAGTLLFPISYIFGDILTEVYGYRRSRRVIWAGFTCLALSAGVFWVVRYLPGDPIWQSYAGDKAYDAILGGMSSGHYSLYCRRGPFWSFPLEFSPGHDLSQLHF
jgi:uncharacterized PurR-regulated membrane protein YhhQ (DUF165 family)